MKYEFKSRVRYSEIGEDRKLTLDGILNYFQDCTTFHSEEVGLGMEKTGGEEAGVDALRMADLCGALPCAGRAAERSDLAL